MLYYIPLGMAATLISALMLALYLFSKEFKKKKMGGELDLARIINMSKPTTTNITAFIAISIISTALFMTLDFVSALLITSTLPAVVFYAINTQSTSVPISAD
jgi:hypothetical protein